MDWRQGRAGYYADFALVPLLIGAALTRLQAPRDVLWVLAGFVTWTFAEYWTHRTLFHRLMRRAHWRHHVHPTGYVAAPPWLTYAAHGVLGATLGYMGAFGFFAGLEAGYMAYLVVHDVIHHQRQKAFGWMRRRWEHHMLHHAGAEVNFGVVLWWWDRLFGTYWNPAIGGVVRGVDTHRRI